MNGLRILFKTNRFNLSKVGEHFINPCCFGEDLAAWLRIKLPERDVEFREAYQEDWGWELPVTQQSDSYCLCMSGNSDESSTNKDEGEWGIVVEKKRSIGQRLGGAGKITVKDRLVKTIEEILCTEPAIREVHREV
jgi:stage III sporulation protein SpoIIIAA